MDSHGRQGHRYSVMVIGTTNRPEAIDPAVLRRMPRAIELTLPGLTQRMHIFAVTLGSERVGSDVDIAELARLTEGMSGSDINVGSPLAPAPRTCLCVTVC